MVNTFILTNSPKECMKLLDYRRLGKQRVEAYQIINVIEDQTQQGWKNHPAAKMWKDHVNGLKYYFNCAVDEWVSRGYKNTMKKYDIPDNSESELPWWYQNVQLQKSHRASLLRKNPEFYEKLFEKDIYYTRGYIWMGNLNEETFNKMKSEQECDLDEICAPIGSGTPSQFRYTKEEVELWSQNKTLNPKTGRKIKESGSIYKDLEKAFKFYTL